MNREILKLKPKRYLCPICGEWHIWPNAKKLEEYYSTYAQALFDSGGDIPEQCAYQGYYIFYHENSYSERLCFGMQNRLCGRSGFQLRASVPINEIEEDPDKPIIWFNEKIITASLVDASKCVTCNFRYKCNILRLSDGRDYHITIPLGIEFDQSDWDKIFRKGEQALQEREEALKKGEKALNNKKKSLEKREETLKKGEQSLQEREEALEKCQQSLQEREETLKKGEQSLQEREAILTIREQELDKRKNEEDAKMAEKAKRTSIKTQLFEKSPKENLEIVKAWAEKYKPVLKWAIPVGAVYAAYRILNSNEFDLSVNNIAETCEKKLGFKVEFLENKRALKELMVLGGLSAGAYGAVKAASTILGSKDEKDISVEEVEADMEQLDTISKKFGWIQPKTEDMLPIAISVIMVYVTLHKPKFTGKLASKVRNLTEDLQIKMETYIDLVKLFIQDKFNIDLSKEEEQKKMKVCAFLVALVGIFAFLYGKKILGDKSEQENEKEKGNKSVEAFVEQAKVIIEKIAPTVYTSLITLLVSKKIVMLDKHQEALEEGEEVKVADAEDDAAKSNPAETDEAEAKTETPSEE